MMYKSNVNVPVLLLFHARADYFKQVFEQVKKARPSILLCYQDGPRNEADMTGILECRQIVETGIDWNCKLYTNYLAKNQGCDPSGYLSRKWAFTIVDKLIILEDDCVPSVSFFRFCKEMLDYYENDQRISMITGINYQEKTDCPYSYFFSSDVAIWGWATWKRVFDKEEEFYDWIKDSYHVGLLKKLMVERNERKELFPMFVRHANSGKAYFETIHIAYHLLNNCLSIVPTVNMINNIGLLNGTHYSASFNMLPRGVRKIFTMNRYEISFPLANPKYVIDNLFYKDSIDKILARNKKWIQKYRVWEVRFYKLKAKILNWM